MCLWYVCVWAYEYSCACTTACVWLSEVNFRCPCLPSTLFETVLFWCYMQQAIWKSLDDFLTSFYHTASRVLELQTCRFWIPEPRYPALVRQALYSWNHLLLMMSKHLPSIRLWPWLSEAAILEIKVVESVARARRWSWGERAATRGWQESSRDCKFAFLPVALSGHTLEFAWGVLWSLPIAGADAWAICTHPAPITFFFFPNAPN